MLASETGWPPPELLVRVSMQTGIFPRGSSKELAQADRDPCSP